MKFNIFLLVFLFPFALLAQSSETDSLLNVLNSHSKEDTTKAKILFELAFKYRRVNADSTLLLGDQILQLSKNIDYPLGILLAYKASSAGHFIKGEYDSAIEYTQKSLLIALEINNLHKIMDAYGNIGVCYDEMSIFPKAIEYYGKAMEIALQLNDSMAIDIAYFNMGIAAERQGDFENALDYTLRSLEIAEKIGDNIGVGYAYQTLGGIHKTQNNIHKSRDYYTRALKIRADLGDEIGAGTSTMSLGDLEFDAESFQKAREYYLQAKEMFEKVGSQKFIAQVIDHIGESYVKEKQYQKGLQYLEEALKLRQDIGVNNGIVSTLTNIGRTYRDMGNFIVSKEYFQKALSLAQKIKTKDQIQTCYKEFSLLASQQGDMKGELKYYKLYTSLKDSLFNETTSKQMLQMETIYETEKKEKENAILRTSLDLEQTENKLQRTILVTTLVVLILILVLTIVLFKGNKLKKRANDILTEKNIEIAAQSEELDQHNEEISAQRDVIELSYQQISVQKEELQTTLEQLQNTQMQLIHSEKMASLGQLTAGIAHEINNPINFISVGTAALEKKIKKLIEGFEDAHLQDKVSDYTKTKQRINQLLEDIKLGADRTEKIVLGLRTFARLDESGQKESDLHKNIEATLTLVRGKSNKNLVNIECAFSPDLPSIMCTPGQINQVFMNLLLNAFDAIGENEGTILISTNYQNNQIEVSIKDSGDGMDEETKKKAFDPFYTTKEVGKGTGLGLSISHSIIEKHQGSIEIDSSIGEGTTFTIKLPIR